MGAPSSETPLLLAESIRVIEQPSPPYESGFPLEPSAGCPAADGDRMVEAVTGARTLAARHTRVERIATGWILVIPGIYIAIRLSLGTQVLVVEGHRPTQAMGRSWALVGGHWWHTFSTLLVAGLLTVVVNAVITTPFSATNWFGQAVAAAAATVITLPYGTLAGVLLYLDLRARKEPLSPDTLTADLQASAA